MEANEWKKKKMKQEKNKDERNNQLKSPQAMLTGCLYLFSFG